MIMPVNSTNTNLIQRALLTRPPQRKDNPEKPVIYTNRNLNTPAHLPDPQRNKEKSEPPVRTSIFYINDFHGKSINIERTMTASNAFDNFKPSAQTDKLKFSSGDILLGEIEKVNQVAVAGENALGIMASAVGNHEYDMPKSIGKLIPDMKFNLLACNIDIRPEYPMSKKVHKSYIQEKNGHRYGVIGTSPTDLISRLKYSVLFDEHEIHDINETIKDIQTEVDNLKAQGVDKIILLSHLGYGYDRKVARETDGIDVILGGHSHNLVLGVKDGENLLYNKSGDPVIITQAGRDGKYFGVLNLEFDQNGVITKVQNNVTPTRGFKRNAPLRYVFEKILGKPEIVGVVKSAPPPIKNDLIDPNPHAQFIVDCMRKELGGDIALLSAANIRGYFEGGNLDTRVLEDMSPFKNNLTIIPYTEKEIVEALKATAKSVVNMNNKPGILHTSGLRYNIDQNGDISDLYYVDKDGKETKIDIDNPREDKIYRTVVNDYYAMGKDNLTMLDKIDWAEKIYDFDFTRCVKDHFKKDKTPVEIKDDGRIKIINSNSTTKTAS